MTKYLVKDVIEKISQRHLNDLDDMELAFLGAIRDEYGHQEYMPLGELAKSFREWYEK